MASGAARESLEALWLLAAARLLQGFPQASGGRITGGSQSVRGKMERGSLPASPPSPAEKMP